MENFDYWRRLDELTLAQAALAIIGANPGDEAGKATQDFKTVLTMLTHAVEGGRLPAKKVYEGRGEVDFITGDVEWHLVEPIDVDRSRVMVDDLRAWLSTRRMTPAFFAQSQSNQYKYPPKLAAAIAAHDACRSALAAGDDLQGKMPMEWMEWWLLARLKQFDITPTGAKDAAAIANWRGPGAPKKNPGA